MSTLFDAPALNRHDGDSLYVSFVAGQALTEPQQSLARSVIGVSASSTNMGVETDPDGEQVLVVNTTPPPVLGSGYDGGTEF